MIDLEGARQKVKCVRVESRKLLIEASTRKSKAGGIFDRWGVCASQSMPRI